MEKTIFPVISKNGILISYVLKKVFCISSAAPAFSLYFTQIEIIQANPMTHTLVPLGNLLSRLYRSLAT